MGAGKNVIQQNRVLEIAKMAWSPEKTKAARSILKDEVSAYKKHVHNEEHLKTDLKDKISEELGFLKPFIPVAGPIGSIVGSL